MGSSLTPPGSCHFSARPFPAALIPHASGLRVARRTRQLLRPLVSGGGGGGGPPLATLVSAVFRRAPPPPAPFLLALWLLPRLLPARISGSLSLGLGLVYFDLSRSLSLDLALGLSLFLVSFCPLSLSACFTWARVWVFLVCVND